jgi:hypothetical protein
MRLNNTGSWTLIPMENMDKETDPRPTPKTKAEKKQLPPSTQKMKDTGHRSPLPMIPELPQLPPAIGTPRPAPATRQASAAAGSAAQLILDELKRALQPQPPILQIPEIDEFEPEYEEEPEDYEENWEPNLASFLGSSYEEQELPYFQLHPQLLMAAQEAVTRATQSAKETAIEPDTPDSATDVDEGEHAGLLEGHITQLTDPQGDPISAKLATHV